MTSQGADLGRVELHFLSWEQGRSPIAVAADELISSACEAADGSRDLGTTLVACSGGRTGRMLLHRLATTARNRRLPLIPPRTCSAAQLVSSLLQPPPSNALSNDNGQVLRRASDAEWLWAVLDTLGASSALKSSAREVLMPSPRDCKGAAIAASESIRLATASQLVRVMATAGFAGVIPSEVAANPAIAASVSMRDRWSALAELEDLANQRLANLCPGLTQPDRHRQRLVREGTSWCQHLVLLGLHDLTPLNRAAISRLLAQGGRVTAYVIAPTAEGTAEWFDEIGCLRDEALNHGPEIPDSMLEHAAGADDQCQAAIARYSSLESSDGVIINCDPDLVPALGRAAQAQGALVHSGAGTTFTRTLVGQLLNSLEVASRGDSAENLRCLVAQPCVGQRANSALPSHDPLAGLNLASKNNLVTDLAHLDALQPSLLPLLAAMFFEFAPRRGDRARSPRGTPGQTWGSLAARLPEVLEGALQSQLGVPVQAAAFDRLIRCCEEIGAGCFRETATEVGAFLRLLNGLFADVQVEVPVEGYEVEVISWLDSLTDPSESVVILGMREGTVPRRERPDGWFTDDLRRQLGLPHRRSQLGRDSLILHCLRQRCGQLSIICGQTDAEDDAAAVSRLIIPKEPRASAKRIVELLEPRHHRRLRHHAPALAAYSAFLRVANPADFPSLPLPTALTPSSIQDFIDSPYSFWAKHVLRVRSGEAPGIALPPMQFGTVLHECLALMASQQFRSLTDRKQMSEFMKSALHQHMTLKFGAKPRAGVQLQMSALQLRLEAALDWHHNSATEGWELKFAEWTLPGSTSINVDGIAQLFAGRVDRIDFNRHSGEWRVVDYKTGDNPKDAGDGRDALGQPKNLQLPIYQDLCSRFCEEMEGKIPSLGVVRLSAESAATLWHELVLDLPQRAACMAKVHDAIRGIRNRNFDTAADFVARRDDGPMRRLTRATCLGEVPAEEEEEE